ncbi:zinc-ribbon domain-containing protein [Paraliobacillus salinarum]|uniref:zinc-ribbon domain-containing protein n=1 Tax=Paraliobacillus salinarum TaxID=1158996 RepID=UPI0015F54A50|nr:zinc ribbon domain-containing protein [Paraliobacillus salinarum]
MYCKNCQAPLETDAKFCVNCGAKVTETSNQTEGTVAEHDQVAATNAGISTENNQGTSTNSNTDNKATANEYVDQGKEVAKKYWSFLPQAVLHPYATSKRVNEEGMINAIITLVLFSLFIPLSSYIGVSTYFRAPFFDTVLKPFVIMLLFFALLIAVKFGVAKLMKANISFIGVLARFGTLMVVPTIFVLASIIFMFLSSYTFSVLLMVCAISFASIASMATIFSIKEKAVGRGGLDVIYGVIITYVAMMIILFIIGDSIMGRLIGDIQNNLYF